MYQRLICEHLAALGLVGRYEPHLVEAWMRAEHDTLDAFSQAIFRREVAAAVACIDAAGAAQSSALAYSLGIHPEHA